MKYHHVHDPRMPAPSGLWRGIGFGLLFTAIIFADGIAKAFADVPAGTPRFAIVAPTQQIDDFGVLSPLPTTGPKALKEWRLLCDAMPAKVITFPALTYQAIVGEFTSGSHSCTAVAVDNSGGVSKPTNPLAFSVPVPGSAPVAPSSLTVQ